jgi:hypothetical protein
VRPRPTEAERCTGDVGAPTGAGPIDKFDHGALNTVRTNRYTHRQLGYGASLRRRRRVTSGTGVSSIKSDDFDKKLDQP